MKLEGVRLFGLGSKKHPTHTFVALGNLSLARASVTGRTAELVDLASHAGEEPPTWLGTAGEVG